MDLRRTHTRQTAAAKAGFSASTGARLDADPRLPSQKQQPARTAPARSAGGGLGERDRADAGGRARPAPGHHPGARCSVGILASPATSAARWSGGSAHWQALHGPEREVIFRQEHPPGQQGLSDFTDAADARRQHRRPAARASALPLPPGVLRLGACRGGARRRELRRPGRRAAERAVGARRRAARASQRQPLGRVPQSRARRRGGPDRALRGAVRALRHDADPQQSAASRTRTARSRPATGTSRTRSTRRCCCAAAATSPISPPIAASSPRWSAAPMPAAASARDRARRSSSRCRRAAPTDHEEAARHRHPQRRLPAAPGVLHRAIAPDRPSAAGAPL